MNDNRSSGGGIGFGLALFLLFLGLKLGHVITWSWWWVTCPLWIPIGFGLLIGLFGGLALLADGDRRYDRQVERARRERQRMARSADLAEYDEWGKRRD